MENRPRCKIPHRSIGLTPVHINYRLAHSIPRQTLRKLAADRDAKLLRLEWDYRSDRVALTTSDYYALTRKIEAEYMNVIETHLHYGKHGPTFLKDPALAEIVLDSWLFLEKQGAVDIHAVCVMPNHVHAIVSRPPGLLSLRPGHLLNRHKRHTARACNRILDRVGEPFWASTYFDRTIRPGTYNTVMKYVLRNPAAAGLIDNWREWKGTFLNPRFADRVVWGEEGV